MLCITYIKMCAWYTRMSRYINSRDLDDFYATITTCSIFLNIFNRVKKKFTDKKAIIVPYTIGQVAAVCSSST